MMELEPNALAFPNVMLNQPYVTTLIIANPLSTNVDLTLSSSAPARYTINPERLHLAGGQAVAVTIRLFVANFPDYAKGVAGQEDYIRIKSTFFEQKVDVTFYLRSRDGTTASSRNRARSPQQARSGAGIGGVVGAAGAREVIEDLQAQLEVKDAKIKELQNVLGQVQAKHPSMEALLRNKEEQMYAEFEEKSKSVLRILRRKDETIEALQHQLEETTSKLQQFRERRELEAQQLHHKSGQSKDYWTGKPLGSSIPGANELAERINQLEKSLEEMQQALTAEEESHAACRLGIAFVKACWLV
jgi:prefoldin subunit 5